VRGGGGGGGPAVFLPYAAARVLGLVRAHFICSADDAGAGAVAHVRLQHAGKRPEADSLREAVKDKRNDGWGWRQRHAEQVEQQGTAEVQHPGAHDGGRIHTSCGRRITETGRSI
jgi:hypothetical protein